MVCRVWGRRACWYGVLRGACLVLWRVRGRSVVYAFPPFFRCLPRILPTSTHPGFVFCPCLRSTFPPSYFYNASSDPDSDRAALLTSLMPRPNKRKETMKYKQYYWAPVTLPSGGASTSGGGRGRRGGRAKSGAKGKQVRVEEVGGKVWEVDWEE